MWLIKAVNLVISWSRDKYLDLTPTRISHGEIKWKLTRACRYMATRVGNLEAQKLLLVDQDPKSSQQDYTDAVFDFLQSLPAFHDIGATLEFTDYCLMEHGHIDYTRLRDIPEHYLILS